MAIFKITPTTSKVTLEDFIDAFGNSGADDTPGADTLIVDPGAFLIGNGIGAVGAELATTGAWTVTVNGSIFSQRSIGVLFTIGNPAISTITIGAEGTVGGGEIGISGSGVTIKNSGVIFSGNGDAIFFASGLTNTVTNSGTISSIAGFHHSIQGGNGVDNVTNSGVLNGKIDLGDGNDRLTNSGQIMGDVDLGDDNDRLTNSGQIKFGDVLLGNGDDTLTNSGQISGDVFLGDGVNKFVNSGTLVGGVRGGVGADTFSNFITTAAGTKFGSLTGAIDLGTGNDKFFGGSQGETLTDAGGSDIYKFGGGSDTYIATGSTTFDFDLDQIDGGAGVDTYFAQAAIHGLDVNLDSVAHDLSLIGTSGHNVAAHTATGIDVAGKSSDTVTSFENVTGGSGDDIIYGNAAANLLTGDLGSDGLFGFAGNDTLIGGDGIDVLVGGAGRDVLNGGLGADQFCFLSITDSGVTAVTRDLIGGGQFLHLDGDKINLSAIDANTKDGAATNDAFNFVGTNTPFTGVPGQLRAYWIATGQIVEGDVNGDKKADFSIKIADEFHNLTLASTDFIL